MGLGSPSSSPLAKSETIMFAWISGTFGALVILLVAVYFLFPGPVFDAAVAMARRSAGLVLKEVTIDGHRVPYLEGGEGEPLLLVHGFGANKDHWTSVARFLTRDFRVIALDVPGFGDSSRVSEASYGLDKQIERLLDFAAKLKLDHFHLGGNSMGGYLAAVLAARYPSKVNSLWLLAPAGVMSANRSELQTLIEEGVNPLLIEDEKAFDRLSDMVFTVKPRMPAQFKRPMLKRAMAEANFNAKIFEEMFSSAVSLEEELVGLDTESLVVWGDGDRVLDPSGLDVLCDLIPQAKCHMMPKMGHVPMLERAADTAKDFLSFRGKAMR